MTTKPRCPRCDRVHTTQATHTIGRFTDHPAYVANTPPVPVPRATRAEAEADECAWWTYLRTGRQEVTS